MTLFGRDWSDYDSGDDMTGFSWITHKATEGTRVTHARLAERLNAARAAGVPVLGAYHVVRTSGADGDVAAQVAYYLTYLDAQVPWWRSWPHWMHQVDLETWPYDNVSAATGKAFVAALMAADPGRFVVTYASRGEYGNQLATWPGPLWNADYRGSANGSYPGDGWVSCNGSPAGWAPIVGQTPVFLQFASTPYDRDAYRGTLDQLLALTSAGGDDMTLGPIVPGISTEQVLRDIWDATVGVVVGNDPVTRFQTPNPVKTFASQFTATAAADQTRLAAVLAAVQALASGGTSVDTSAVIAAIHDATAAESQAVAALQAEVDDLRTKLTAAGQALT